MKKKKSYDNHLVPNGHLDLPERNIYTNSRDGEDVDARMFPCGTTIESGTHIVGRRVKYARRNGMCYRR